MDLKKIFILFTLMALQAQSKTLTWVEALDLAQKNSFELQTAIANYQSTQALETSARSGFFPNLSASVGESKSGAKNTASTESYSAQISLSQNLFSGFADLNKSRQANANTKAASATLQSAKAKLSADFKQALAAFYFARDYKKLSSQIVKRRDDNLKNVDLRFHGGRENKGSVLLSVAYLEQAKLDDLTSQHDADVATEDFKRFMGLQRSEELDINEAVPQMQNLSDVPDFEKISLKTPDVIQATAAEESSHYSVDIARSQFIPSLDVSGNYGKYDSVFFPEQDRWSVGITLSVPLFDGGRDYSSLKSASYKANSSSAQKIDVTQKTLTRVKQAYYNFIESVQKEKVDQSFKSAAEVRSQIARSKYNNGLMSFEDWDLVENDLITREKASLNSHRERITNESLWEQAQGIGVFQ